MSSNDLSFDRAYEALKRGRAFFELTGWSSISVTGKDRQTFLNNFCTNDIKRLAPGSSCEAFFTNVKGKIVGHGAVDCRDGELMFLGAPGQSPRLLEHLDRYVIREDVKLRDTTHDRNYALVTGDAPSGTSHIAISWDITGRSDSRLIELNRGDVAGFVRDLLATGFVPAGAEAFTAARVEAAMPLYGIDFDEENLPQEVGRNRQAINFSKGCYLGQETVARIDALGHVNQKIVVVRFFGEEVPPKGVEFQRDGRSVGRVTSAAFSPKLGAPLALAMVRREANMPGTRMQSLAGDCEVIAL